MYISQVESYYSKPIGKKVVFFSGLRFVIANASIVKAKREGDGGHEMVRIASSTQRA